MTDKQNEIDRKRHEDIIGLTIAEGVVLELARLSVIHDKETFHQQKSKCLLELKAILNMLTGTSAKRFLSELIQSWGYNDTPMEDLPFGDYGPASVKGAVSSIREGNHDQDYEE